MNPAPEKIALIDMDGTLVDYAAQMQAESDDLLL